MHDETNPNEHPQSDACEIAKLRKTVIEMEKRMEVLQHLEPFMEQMKRNSKESIEVLNSRLYSQSKRIDALHKAAGALLHTSPEQFAERLKMLPTMDNPVPEAFQQFTERLETSVHSLGDDLAGLADQLNRLDAFMLQVLARVSRLETIIGVTHEMPFQGPIGEKIDLRYQSKEVQDAYKARIDPGEMLVREWGLAHGGADAPDAEADGRAIVSRQAEDAMTIVGSHETTKALARGVGAALVSANQPIQGSMREIEKRQDIARREVRQLAKDVERLIDEQAKSSQHQLSAAEAMMEHAVKIMRSVEERVASVQNLLDISGPSAENENEPDDAKGGPEDAMPEVRSDDARGGQPADGEPA